MKVLLRFILNFVILIIILFQYNLNCQEDLWQVTTLVEPSAGYIKFDNNGFENFYLFDNYGNKIFIDSSTALFGTNYVKMLPNGNWSFYKNSKFHIYDQDLKLIDSINFNSDVIVDIHDMNVMPNGHYLLICIENRTIDMSVIIEGGQVDATVIGSHLYEVDSDGTVFWTWSSFDHFDIFDVTGEVDLTHKVIPFTHSNSVTFDLDGNILLSSRNLDEITKIDKVTGDIIWRWGGSGCENNEFTFLNDTINGFFGFAHQHSINVLPNGNILLYDNGNLKPEEYSRAVEYELDRENKTVTKVWEYSGDSHSYYSAKGSVQRLENGNTFINWGEDKITEVSKGGNIVFEMRSKDYYPVYRAFRYITRMNAVGFDMKFPGTYIFRQDTNETNITIDVKSVSGMSYSMVEKHYYSPVKASYMEYNFSEILPYRWVFSKRGINNINADIRINLQGLNFNGDKSKLTIYGRTSENAGGFGTIETTYDIENDELVGNFSNLGEFVIGSNVLEKPNLNSPLNGSKIPSNDGFLNWDKTTGATKYNLQISLLEDFSEFEKDTIIGTDIFYNYQNLNNKTTYFWRVAAMNHKDTSDWSDYRSFITELGPPELISPIDGEEGLDTNVTAKWMFVSDSCKFWVQVTDVDDFTNLIYENKNILETEVNFSVDEFYTLYFWRVCSLEGNDTSQWSSIRSFLTMMSAPNIINPTDAQINLPDLFTIEWNDVKGVTGYNLQVSDKEDFSELYIDKTNIQFSEFEISELEHFTEYFLRIIGFNGKDTSDWSDTIKFTTSLITPSLLLPENDLEEVELPVVFAWTKDTNAEYNKIQISYEYNFDSVLYEKDVSSNTLISEWNFPKNTQIFWRIKSINGLHESNWSDVWSFTTESGLYLSTPILSLPVDKSMNNERDGILSWSEVNDANNYILNLSKNGLFEVLTVIDSNISNANYAYQDLEFDSTYFWRVKAIGTDKESRWSNVFSFTIKPAISIKEDLINRLISIFPQPANNFLYVHLADDIPNNLNIIITDGLGRKFYETKIIEKYTDLKLEIDISSFPTGVYFMNMSSGVYRYSNKIIIIPN